MTLSPEIVTTLLWLAVHAVGLISAGLCRLPMSVGRTTLAQLTMATSMLLVGLFAWATPTEHSAAWVASAGTIGLMVTAVVWHSPTDEVDPVLDRLLASGQAV
ncbi:hypothetical protein Mal64_34480 [Pseudobythopirellula maris]|uniref:Uncharacterized protein n=1 Tax=Pseudobythopirellula maris TaxID=2527991 RepID=A0A5C5ZHM2_9BACT|nr:hypothetical protein [Pseudobythopirellula maris]TWT86620.1 hypothetical protein Mal64_34480 [Pseudobythopirellula maris]